MTNNNATATATATDNNAAIDNQLLTAINTALDKFDQAADSLLPAVIGVLRRVSEFEQKGLIATYQPLVTLFERSTRGLDRARLATWVASNTPLSVVIKEYKLDKIKYSQRAAAARTKQGLPVWDFESLERTPFWQHEKKILALGIPTMKKVRSSLPRQLARLALVKAIRADKALDPNTVSKNWVGGGDYVETIDEFLAGLRAELIDSCAEEIQKESFSDWKEAVIPVLCAEKQTAHQDALEKERALQADKARIDSLLSEATAGAEKERAVEAARAQKSKGLPPLPVPSSDPELVSELKASEAVKTARVKQRRDDMAGKTA